MRGFRLPRCLQSAVRERLTQARTGGSFPSRPDRIPRTEADCARTLEYGNLGGEVNDLRKQMVGQFEIFEGLGHR